LDLKTAFKKYADESTAAAEEWKKIQEVANTKGTFFIHGLLNTVCTYASLGCTYTTEKRNNLHDHHLRCSFNPNKKEVTDHCSYCNRNFDNRASLNTHKKSDSCTDPEVSTSLIMLII